MRLSLALAVALLTTAAAAAQTPPGAAPVRTGPPPTGAQFIARLDVDKDGVANKKEAAADAQFAGDFDKIDANHDGAVTPSEMDAFFAAMMAQAPKP